MNTKFQDYILLCTECSNHFVFTIGQQYKADEENEKIAEPTLCPACEVRQERMRAWLAAQSQQQGEVKWFDARKGFGFIKSGEESKIFVHHSNIIGQKRLRRGQRVQFTVNKTEQGAQATEVTVLEKEASRQ